MMEHVREEQLALYAWGDLPPQESRAVTAHLQDCGQCQKVLAEFHETRSFVTVSLQNPDASELSEVHTRLAAKLQPRQASERHWAWWATGVAAVLALLTLPHRFEHQPIPIQRTESLLTENINPGPTIKIPLTPIAASRPRRLRFQKAGIRAVALITQVDREPLIKMTTADPNVIILWQSSGKAE